MGPVVPVGEKAGSQAMHAQPTKAASAAGHNGLNVFNAMRRPNVVGTPASRARHRHSGQGRRCQTSLAAADHHLGTRRHRRGAEPDPGPRSEPRPKVLFAFIPAAPYRRRRRSGAELRPPRDPSRDPPLNAGRSRVRALALDMDDPRIAERRFKDRRGHRRRHCRRAGEHRQKQQHGDHRPGGAGERPGEPFGRWKGVMAHAVPRLEVSTRG